TEKTGAIVLYFSILTMLLGLSTAVLGWEAPDATDGAVLVLFVSLGGVCQILLTRSYRYADTSIIAPFDYTTMIWALLLGWFVFGELPTLPVSIGGVIVAAAGLFVVWREGPPRLHRRQAIE